MINFDDPTKENLSKHNPNWPQIPDHPYRILIVGNSVSGKTNSLFCLKVINQILIKFINTLKIHIPYESDEPL